MLFKTEKCFMMFLIEGDLSEIYYCLAVAKPEIDMWWARDHFSIFWWACAHPARTLASPLLS
jgi:hypothetical protein